VLFSILLLNALRLRSYSDSVQLLLKISYSAKNSVLSEKDESHGSAPSNMTCLRYKNKLLLEMLVSRPAVKENNV
jgi:hypothetical protein